MHETESKKPYVTPELVEYGSVSELTERIGSGFCDGNCHPS